MGCFRGARGARGIHTVRTVTCTCFMIFSPFDFSRLESKCTMYSPNCVYCLFLLHIFLCSLFMISPTPFYAPHVFLFLDTI